MLLVNENIFVQLLTAVSALSSEHDSADSVSLADDDNASLREEEVSRKISLDFIITPNQLQI